MKQIINFCLYNIIALSTIDIMCCEKGFKDQQKEKLPSFSFDAILNKENNSNIPTLNDLHALFAQQTLINANNNISTTIELQNPEKKEYIQLDFSSINTKEKYDDIFKKTKGLPVKITCNYNNCPTYRSGILSKTYRAIRYHRAKTHYVCSCNTEHASSDKARNCILCSRPKNTKQNKNNNTKTYQSLCAAIFDFNTVPTKKEFEKKAEQYKNSGERIGIVCDMCGKCIFTTYKCVYRNIDTHRVGCKKKNQ